MYEELISILANQLKGKINEKKRHSVFIFFCVFSVSVYCKELIDL